MFIAIKSDCELWLSDSSLLVIINTRKCRIAFAKYKRMSFFFLLVFFADVDLCPHFSYVKTITIICEKLAWYGIIQRYSAYGNIIIYNKIPLFLWFNGNSLHIFGFFFRARRFFLLSSLFCCWNNFHCSIGFTSWSVYIVQIEHRTTVT